MAYLIISVWLMLCFNVYTSGNKLRLRETGKRLAIIEDRQNDLSDTHREDLYDVNLRLDTLEAHLNASLEEFLNQQPAVKTDKIFSDTTLSHEVKIISQALSGEKSRWRREASAIKASIKGLKQDVGSMGNTVEEIEAGCENHFQDTLNQVTAETQKLDSSFNVVKGDIQAYVDNTIQNVKDDIQSSIDGNKRYMRSVVSSVDQKCEDIVQNINEVKVSVGDIKTYVDSSVKTSVKELKTYVDSSIQGLKDEIFKVLRDSAQAVSTTTAQTTTLPTTQARAQTTTLPTTQARAQTTTLPTTQARAQTTTLPTTEAPAQTTTLPTTQARAQTTTLPTTQARAQTTTLPTTQATIPTTTSPKQLPSCLELYHSGERQSGVHTIYPLPSNQPVQVYCDMDTEGGGWTVFQRRQDGSVDFNRTWAEYASGFGNISGEFWLGNDLISSLTSQGPHELRIDLKDFKKHSAYAKYNTFKVLPSDGNYKLEVGGFSGSAGDSLGSSSGRTFSTWDRDHDRSYYNCAQHGAWWYYGCGTSRLNGLYGHGYRGVVWWHWKRYDPLMWTEMKFRAKH